MTLFVLFAIWFVSIGGARHLVASFGCVPPKGWMTLVHVAFAAFCFALASRWVMYILEPKEPKP